VFLFTLEDSADGLLVLRAQEHGLSVVCIQLMLIAFNLIYTVLSGPSGTLSDRVERDKLLAGLAFVALCLFISWYQWKSKP